MELHDEVAPHIKKIVDRILVRAAYNAAHDIPCNMGSDAIATCFALGVEPELHPSRPQKLSIPLRRWPLAESLLDSQ